MNKQRESNVTNNTLHNMKTTGTSERYVSLVPTGCGRMQSIWHQLFANEDSIIWAFQEKISGVVESYSIVLCGKSLQLVVYSIYDRPVVEGFIIISGGFILSVRTIFDKMRITHQQTIASIRPW